MILRGDCRQVLPTLGADSVHSCVTSPPYFGLRSYLRADHPDKAKEIGSEPLHDCLGWATGTPCGTCFVCVMVDVFRHVRRVLRPDGVCWINIGDSYAGSGRGGNTGDDTSTLEGGKATQEESRRAAVAQRGSRLPAGFHAGAVDAGAVGRAWVKPPGTLKQKDLCGVPYRLALALQTDGWWWRDTVIWRKPNPMPSSVNDRCTPAYEPVLMMTKSARYHFDWKAIATEAQEGVGRTVRPAGWASGEGSHHPADWATAERQGSMRNTFARNTKATPGDHGQKPQHREDREPVAYEGLARRRNVWDIPTQGYSEAHFATFPEKLPELCILATCPPGGKVLDPFLGSGTTGQVAQRLGRQWIGIDLNDDYQAMQEQRALREQPGLPLGAAP